MVAPTEPAPIIVIFVPISDHLFLSGSFTGCSCSLVKIRIANPQQYVYGNLYYIDKIKRKCKIKQETQGSCALCLIDLNKLPDDTEDISKDNKDLKEYALSLCGPGSSGLADRDRP